MGHIHMTIVGGIEGPAQDPDPFWAGKQAYLLFNCDAPGTFHSLQPDFLILGFAVQDKFAA